MEGILMCERIYRDWLQRNIGANFFAMQLIQCDFPIADVGSTQECMVNPCKHGGTCSFRLGKTLCFCTPCRGGDLCDLGTVH